MNRILLAAFAVLSAPALLAFDEQEFYQPYAALLAEYVEPSGVDYDVWRGNLAHVRALDNVLAAMAEVDVDALDEDQQQAFYINLYNAAMLQAVLQHYPISSVTDILPAFGIFKKKYIEQGDRMLSLDDVEKGILLERWDEPRIHFAVNCASVSCPPLRGEPYYGSKLEQQLDQQTAQFAQSYHAAQTKPGRKKIFVSSLFNWYADDFPVGPVDYLNRYRDQKLDSGRSIGFIDYDWSLNEAKN